MKKYFFLFFIFISSHISAQDWNLIPFDKTMYYGDDVNFLTPVYTNNILTLGVDTTAFHLNTFVGYCDTCTVLNPNNYYLKEKAGFLNKLFIKQGADFLILNPDSLIIKTQMPLNSPWLFDPNNALNAEIILEESTFVFGIADSVKTILVSNNDTIKISKNFGVLKYQRFGDNWNLSGARSLNSTFGIVYNGFKDFYNFEIGDVFMYKETEFDGSLNIAVEALRYIKKEIMSKTETLNNISYQIKKSTYSETIGEPLYTVTTITENYTYDENNLAEKQSFDIFKMGWYCTFFKKSLVEKIGSTKIQGRIALLDYSSEFYELEYDPIHYEYLKIEEGKGVLNEVERCFEHGYTLTQIGTIKNSIKTGEVWEDWRFTGVKDLAQNENINIYPNPFKNELLVYFEETYLNAEIEIINILGECVYTNSFLGENKLYIDTKDFTSGVYFLKIKLDGNLFQQKMIKY